MRTLLGDCKVRGFKDGDDLGKGWTGGRVGDPAGLGEGHVCGRTVGAEAGAVAVDDVAAEGEGGVEGALCIWEELVPELGEDDAVAEDVRGRAERGVRGEHLGRGDVARKAAFRVGRLRESCENPREAAAVHELRDEAHGGRRDRAAVEAHEVLTVQHSSVCFDLASCNKSQ